MFDKVERHYHNSSPSRIDVHEHRAPTDESIRLAEEMREKILENIIYQEHVNDNHFDYRVYVFKDVFTRGQDIEVVAEINGTKIHARENIDRKAIGTYCPTILFSEEDKEYMIAKIKAISHIITIALLGAREDLANVIREELLKK